MKSQETHAKSTVPDELSSDTEGTRDTEENGVEVLLGKTVADDDQRSEAEI
jgi:hypothetical protein